MTQEIRDKLTVEEVQESVNRAAERSRAAGYLHISIRYANECLNELFGTEYTVKATPLYQAIYRPGQLQAATASRPIQVEPEEFARWILEDFTGPRP